MFFLTGTMAELFRKEKQASTFLQRVAFISQFKRIQGLNGNASWVLADTAHMAGLLVRWLVDTIESPPRRVGSTPEMQADHSLFVLCVFADVLQVTLHDTLQSDEEPQLYSLFPRAAQAAWDRLVTRHFAQLPLPARIHLSQLMCTIRDEEGEDAALCALGRDLISLLDTGSLVLDCGHGVRQCFGVHMQNSLILCTRAGALLPTLFEGREGFTGAPRRLALLAYSRLLSQYDGATRAFATEEVREVRCLMYKCVHVFQW
jgi:hypothetical protein